MLTLSELLVASRRSASALDLADLPLDLVGRITAQAAPEAMTAGDFVRMAVADFADFAQAEDWTHLMSRLRDERDVGRVCLMTMLEWRLAAAEPLSPMEPTP